MKSKKYKKRKWKWKQKDGWLNRYDFAYAGRDTINTGVNAVNRIAPGFVKEASREVDLVAEKIIRQFIQEGGTEVKRVATIIIKNAIEEIYKTPFRLLGNFGKKKYLQMKKFQ